MNSVNIVYLFGVLCILVSPSFTAPPIASPNASVDEIFQKLIRDGIEITSGVSHVGADGKLVCRSGSAYACPAGAESCSFRGILMADGNNIQTTYKCSNKAGAVLSTAVKIEPFDSIDSYNADNLDTRAIDPMDQKLDEIVNKVNELAKKIH